MKLTQLMLLPQQYNEFGATKAEGFHLHYCEMIAADNKHNWTGLMK